LGVLLGKSIRNNWWHLANDGRRVLDKEEIHNATTDHPSSSIKRTGEDLIIITHHPSPITHHHHHPHP
jgi:hypothetical protein